MGVWGAPLAMDHPPVCPNCEAILDLTQRNPVHSVVYRHVQCPGCRRLCVLEGPQVDVAYAREPSG